jgi:hypothetical protein
MCSPQHSPFTPPFHSSTRSGFLAHLISYLTVNIGLLLVNLLTAPESVWAIWPLLGWGLGVLKHGLYVVASSDSSPTAAFSQPSTAPPPEASRIEKRLQHLEAIVADEDLESPLSSSGATPETSTTYQV